MTKVIYVTTPLISSTQVRYSIYAPRTLMKLDGLTLLQHLLPINVTTSSNGEVNGLVHSAPLTKSKL